MRRFEYDCDLLVMSRRDAEMFYNVPTNGDVPCISITDPESPGADLRFCRHVLRLSFHDVEDGDEAARFAQLATGPLVVHCEGGVSRSAGVAAGLIASNPESDEAGLHREKCPNATCKMRVMKAALELRCENDT